MAKCYDHKLTLQLYSRVVLHVSDWQKSVVTPIANRYAKIVIGSKESVLIVRRKKSLTRGIGLEYQRGSNSLLDTNTAAVTLCENVL